MLDGLTPVRLVSNMTVPNWETIVPTPAASRSFWSWSDQVALMPVTRLEVCMPNAPAGAWLGPPRGFASVCAHLAATNADGGTDRTAPPLRPWMVTHGCSTALL